MQQTTVEDAHRACDNHIDTNLSKYLYLLPFSKTICCFSDVTTLNKSCNVQILKNRTSLYNESNKIEDASESKHWILYWEPYILAPRRMNIYWGQERCCDHFDFSKRVLDSHPSVEHKSSEMYATNRQLTDQNNQESNKTFMGKENDNLEKTRPTLNFHSW